jgi:mannose-6-phosphate isomerase-like protein (cupin superfamily)
MTLITDPTDDRFTRRGALHVPAGEGLTKWVAGDEYIMKLTATESNGSLGFVVATVPPGGGPVAHAHLRSDEAFYLLSGELEFLNGDRTFTADPGDFVFIPRNHRHRFRNISSGDARMLFFFTPAGPEQLFVKAGDDPVPGGRPQPWDVDKMVQLGELISELETDVLPEP